MILRNLIRGLLFRYNTSYPYGQVDVKCMPDNTYTSTISSGYTLLYNSGGSRSWGKEFNARLILSEDKIVPDKDMYTMPYKDIIPDSVPEVLNLGYASDTTSGSDRPRKVIRQSYTNSTEAPIVVNTLGLVFSGSGLYGLDNSGNQTLLTPQYTTGGVVLLAVQPLDEPVTIAVGETKTFQMTLYLCE